MAIRTNKNKHMKVKKGIISKLGSLEVRGTVNLTKEEQEAVIGGFDGWRLLDSIFQERAERRPIADWEESMI